MYLVGTVTLTKVVRKEWEGRVYFKCQALGDDKEVYSVSLSSDLSPRQGDVLQMILEPSDKDWKPYIRFAKPEK